MQISGKGVRAALWLGLGLSTGLGAGEAATLEFGASYVSALPGGAGVRFGVTDVAVAGGQLGAAVSDRALEVGFRRGLALPPLGAVTASTDVVVAWSGGVRAVSRATGALGPVALNVGASVFTVPAAHVDPLSVWSFAPTDVRAAGWNADVTVRYRVSRTLVAVGGAELGGQASGFVGLEGRRDLTRPVPASEVEGTGPEVSEFGNAAPGNAAPGDAAAGPAGDSSADAPIVDPTGPDLAGETAELPQLGPSEPVPPELETPESDFPELETTGTLGWRVGARAGQGVFGVTGGVTYAAASGLTLGADALLGPGALGLSASLTAPDVFGEGSALRVYGAFEPWRAVSLPLRVGVETSVPLGAGTLGVDLRGGQDARGAPGYGVRLSYRLPLGNTGAAPGEAP